MNINIEEEIIKNYVKKVKQERIIWELQNQKKREKVFWKFAGTNLFNENCLRTIKYMNNCELEKYLFQMSGTKDVYYMGESYIGELCLRDAVQKAGMGEICIIYCGKGIGYYQGEQEYGSPPRFLLIKTI